MVAGLGGGTGTGTAPVVARIATAQGCEVTAVVTWPFPFEGKRRVQQAKRGLTALQAYVPKIVTPGSLIFKAVQKKWCIAWCRALKKSPTPPESAVGEGSERSHVDRSVVPPE